VQIAIQTLILTQFVWKCALSSSKGMYLAALVTFFNVTYLLQFVLKFKEVILAFF